MQMTKYFNYISLYLLINLNDSVILYITLLSDDNILRIWFILNIL